jgi:hypothetical protein
MASFLLARPKRRLLSSAPQKRHSPRSGRPYPWIAKSMANHYYIYAVDGAFGPFFLKFCTYFPYNAQLCLNDHEYAVSTLTR